MIPELECTVYDSEKIDALTVTSKTVSGRAMISGLYHLFGAQSEELAFQKNWGSLGYRGLQCGSVRWGSRLDGSALFSSGSDAMIITKLLLEGYNYLELNTTRVDLCIDVALKIPMRGWLRGLREDDGFRDLHSQANRKTTLIESDTGDTLYIGSRHSGRFGRVYDKSLAYGVDLGSVYRFEIETKKQVSPAVFKRLFPECEDVTYAWDFFPSRCRGIIQSQFATWGIALNLQSDNVENLRAETRISTIDSQLEWLSRTVAPMLVKLKQAGYQSSMLDALGLDMVDFGADLKLNGDSHHTKSLMDKVAA